MSLARPAGLALLGDRLVIVDSELHQVVECELQGKFISKFGQRGGGPGEFNFPTHVAVDDRRQIYVTDALNCRIQVFTADGQFVRMFGSTGDTAGHFSRPKGVAVDHAGHVYVVDAVFGNVQIFNDSGRLLLDFGEGGSAPGQFWLPNAIAINSRNEIYRGRCLQPSLANVPLHWQRMKLLRHITEARKFHRQTRATDFQVCCLAGFQTCGGLAFSEPSRFGNRRYSRFGNLRYTGFARVRQRSYEISGLAVLVCLVCSVACPGAESQQHRQFAA